MRWIVPRSGGKDSTATIIVMLEQGLEIEKIVHVRMMATETLPATHKVMTDFVDDCIARFTSMRLCVELKKSLPFDVLASKITKRSKYPDRIGKPKGFTECARGMCSFQKQKVKLTGGLNDGNTILGICYDEPERTHSGRHSVLFDNKITQRMAYEICKDKGLLSPLYELGVKRDGCFFCPNAAKKEIRLLNDEQIALIKKWVSMTPPGAYLQDDWRKHIDDYFAQTTLF